MATRDPGVRLLILAQDGATLASTLSQQMKRVPLVDEPVLVIVTVGSRNVLAQMQGKDPGPADGDAMFDAATAILDELGRRLADPILLLANIPPLGGEEPPLLAEYNKALAEVAAEQGAALIDLHTHFQGHGPDAGDEAWLTDALDPTPAGASEIRRLLWQALTEL
jgi:lysophospholipase L1-like esterase